MQRKLLALAVAGAFVVPGAAYAQVTISGQMRFSIDNVRWNGGAAANGAVGVSKWGLNSHSANIKFASRESLGGGLTAWGTLENGVADGRLNAQNALWNGRNSGIGIDSTSWGTVMIGLWDSPYKQLDGAWSIGQPAAYSFGATAPILGNGDTTGSHPNPNCSVNESGAGYIIAAVPATVCSNSAGSATAFQRRLNNTFQYWSPVWNGVQLLIATQGNEEKANGITAGQARADPKLWSYGLRWSGPRWALIVGHEQHKNYNLNAAQTNRSSKDTGTKFGGNYNFGPVQLGLAHERIRLELGTPAAPTDLRQRNTSFNVAVPLGVGAFRGQVGRSRQSGSASAADANARLFNLSYEHNMSKRTLVYIAYAKLSQGDGRAAQFGTNINGTNGRSVGNLAGQDPRFLSFGMNHTF